jgi:hypothetical protein
MLSAVIFGFMLIVLGLEIISNPIFYSAKHRLTLDLSGYNIIAGGLLIIFAVLNIWLEMKKYSDKKERDIK